VTVLPLLPPDVEAESSPLVLAQAASESAAVTPAATNAMRRRPVLNSMAVPFSISKRVLDDYTAVEMSFVAKR
jgi:hypothetical protein